MRRPAGEQTVVGTLLGSVDGQMVDLQTCFSVPLDHADGSLVVDGEYMQKMLKFHRKVNPKEALVGLYISGQEIDLTAVNLFQYYQSISKDKKNGSPLAGSPLILLIDPTMQNNRLSIKVHTLSFLLTR